MQQEPSSQVYHKQGSFPQWVTQKDPSQQRVTPHVPSQQRNFIPQGSYQQGVIPHGFTQCNVPTYSPHKFPAKYVLV